MKYSLLSWLLSAVSIAAVLGQKSMPKYPGIQFSPNGKLSITVFNRHSGYGGYTDWARGARQISVSEDMLAKNVVETWIRLENGKVSGQVTLNFTFGTDQYPGVEKSKSSAL